MIFKLRGKPVSYRADAVVGIEIEGRTLQLVLDDGTVTGYKYESDALATEAYDAATVAWGSAFAQFVAVGGKAR